MPSFTLHNARLILGQETLRGHLRIEAGRITDIGRGALAGGGGIDLEGDWLMPGLVEVHTDNLERHVMPRPKVYFPMQSAMHAHDAEVSAAGITTVFDAIGVGDPYGEGFRAHDQSALLTALDRLEKGRALRAEHFVHVRCELPAPNARELFAPFQDHARLKMISLMDHTPGQRQWRDIEHARTYYTGKKGWSDAKFDEEVRLAPERQARHAVPNRSWFSALARDHGVVLATHDDTTSDHVQQALELGATVCEFPTTFEAACSARTMGLATVAGAPNVVRGGSHSGNISARELARAGLLDILSSDYVPASLLQAAWRLPKEAGLDLAQAVATVSRNPARACGLKDRGEIAVGLRADLLRVQELDGIPLVRQVWRGGCRVI